MRAFGRLLIAGLMLLILSTAMGRNTPGAVHPDSVTSAIESVQAADPPSEAEHDELAHHWSAGATQTALEAERFASGRLRMAWIDKAMGAGARCADRLRPPIA